MMLPPLGPFEPGADPAGDLLAIARRWHAMGKPARDICTALAQLNAQWGCPVPAVAAVVRQLPGLEDWCPVADWRERWRDPAYLAEVAADAESVLWRDPVDLTVSQPSDLSAGEIRP